MPSAVASTAPSLRLRFRWPNDGLMPAIRFPWVVWIQNDILHYPKRTMMPVQTIWLVDDDADDCMLFEDAITEMGVTIAVVCVTDGADLLNKLRQATVVPDILFLDVNMPVKNGLDCLNELKRDERFNQVPVVMWSTSGQSETVEKAYQAGARLFMKKPHNFNKLKTLLYEILQLDLETSVSLEDFLVGK